MARDTVWWALRKLGGKEQMVKILQSMYKNAQSRVRVNGTFNEFFDPSRIASGLSVNSFVIYHSAGSNI